jgi:hypothetical protein
VEESVLKDIALKVRDKIVNPLRTTRRMHVHPNVFGKLHSLIKGAVGNAVEDVIDAPLINAVRTEMENKGG